MARASQRRLELPLNHRPDELTYPITETDFDRVKPNCREDGRRFRFRLQEIGEVVLVLVVA
jgi:hypothetical protein